MLTNRLAFLIQLDSEADRASGRIEGRAEHIDSGDRIDFHSAQALLDFLAREHKAMRNESAVATESGVPRPKDR